MSCRAFSSPVSFKPTRWSTQSTLPRSFSWLTAAHTHSGLPVHFSADSALPLPVSISPYQPLAYTHTQYGRSNFLQMRKLSEARMLHLFLNRATLGTLHMLLGHLTASQSETREFGCRKLISNSFDGRLIGGEGGLRQMLLGKIIAYSSSVQSESELVGRERKKGLIA